MTTSIHAGAAVGPDELYVAGYGSGAQSGLYRFRLGGDGVWTGSQQAEVRALSALARHRSMPVVYGVSGSASEQGWLHSWHVDGTTTTLGAVSTGGREPCHLAVDPDGRWIVVANYATSSLAVWALADDGSVLGDPQLLQLAGSGVDADRQEAAHPHQVVLDRDEAYAVDLGADVVRRVTVRPCGHGFSLALVQEVAVPDGTGPRHLVMLGNDLVAISGELASSVLVGRPGRRFAGWSVASSTRRGAHPGSDYERNYPSDITTSPDHRFVYLSNRGHDTVATFEVRSGQPVLVGEIDLGGKWPQHLMVRGDELLVAARDSGRVCALRLEDGVPTTSRVLFECPGATWLLGGRT